MLHLQQQVDKEQDEQELLDDAQEQADAVQKGHQDGAEADDGEREEEQEELDSWQGTEGLPRQVQEALSGRGACLLLDRNATRAKDAAATWKRMAPGAEGRKPDSETEAHIKAPRSHHCDR